MPRGHSGLPGILRRGARAAGLAVAITIGSPGDTSAQVPASMPTTSVIDTTPPVVADTTLPVAAHDLPRGVELALEDIAPGPGAAKRVGWTTRRVIRAGETLTEPAVEPPPLVRAGQVVQYIVRRGAIQLSISGTAMASGHTGEAIPIRLGERQRVEAVITGPGRVESPPARRRPEQLR